MNLSSYLTPDRVVVLRAATKSAALDELVAALAGDDPAARRRMKDAVLRREAMMSTGIGHGLAIPHVRMPGLAQAVMAVGVSPAGLSDYEGLDAEPVRVVVLIAAPQGQHDLYIRLLAEVVNVLKDPQLRRQVVQAGDTARMHEILTRNQP